MDWSTIINWIPTEAGATWLVPIIGSLAAAVLWIRDKFIPQSVVFSEISNSSLVDIDASIAEYLTVKVGETSITSLSGVRAELYNVGGTVVTNGSLTIEALKSTVILSLAARTSDENCKIETKNEGKKAKIEFEYLNSFRKHKHTIVISLTLIGGENDWRIAGGGRGWSLGVVRLGERRQIAEMISSIGGLVTLSLLIVSLVFLMTITSGIKVFTSPLSVGAFLGGVILASVFLFTCKKYRSPTGKSSQSLVSSLRFIEENNKSASVSVASKNFEAILRRDQEFGIKR